MRKDRCEARGRTGRLKATWCCLLLCVLVLCGTIGGCRPKDTAVGESETTTGAALRVGLLPIVDSLPFLVARERGYYAAAPELFPGGVELIMFNSALDRDSALQAGRIDAAVGDPIAAALLWQTAGVRIVAVCQGMTPDEGVFAILASPKSGLNDKESLAGARIAISPNSIIEYVTDSLLAEAGLPLEQVQKVPVASIPQRLEMLLSGAIEAASLPDPLATLAEQRGAIRLLDDSSGRNLSQSVLMFRLETLEEHGDQGRALLSAYDRAVREIMANPEGFRPLLEEELRLPPDLPQYVIKFSPPRVPREEEIEPLLSWMEANRLVADCPSYRELVLDGYLPDKGVR